MNESVHDVQTVQQALLKNLAETEAALTAQSHLNRDLQQGLMSIRMVPFSSIGERLYRIVRQTGKELNKRANLELSGTEVELDRSVLEKMTAPFEHLLRNSIAHGLETPEQRNARTRRPSARSVCPCTRKATRWCSNSAMMAEVWTSPASARRPWKRACCSRMRLPVTSRSCNWCSPPVSRLPKK